MQISNQMKTHIRVGLEGSHGVRVFHPANTGTYASTWGLPYASCPESISKTQASTLTRLCVLSTLLRCYREGQEKAEALWLLQG